MVLGMYRMIEQYQGFAMNTQCPIIPQPPREKAQRLFKIAYLALTLMIEVREQDFHACAMLLSLSRLRIPPSATGAVLLVKKGILPTAQMCLIS